MTLFKTFGNRDGFAFIVVIAVLFLVTILAMVAFNTSDTDRQISSNNLSSTRAYYAAEAGAIRAMAVLTDSANWRAGFGSTIIGNNSHYIVQIIDSFAQPALKDSLILLSTGNAIGSPSGTQSIVEVLLAPKKVRRFRYAAFGDTLLYYNGDAQADAYNSDSGIYVPGGMGGDLGSNKLIYLNGSDEIYGDVGTPDTIQMNGSINIYGDTNNSAAVIPLDSIAASEMAEAEANSNAPAGLTLVGGAFYDPITKRLRATGTAASITMSSGTYYFSDIDIQSGAKLIIPTGANVTIYLKDSLYASGGTVVNSTLKPENLQIYSTGRSVYLTGNVALYAAIYAPKAEIKVNGNSQIYGSVIGKSVYVNGNGAIHYDRALQKVGYPGKGKYKKVAWKVL